MNGVKKPSCRIDVEIGIIGVLDALNHRKSEAAIDQTVILFLCGLYLSIRRAMH